MPMVVAIRVNSNGRASTSVFASDLASHTLASEVSPSTIEHVNLLLPSDLSPEQQTECAPSLVRKEVRLRTALAAPLPATQVSQLATKYKYWCDRTSLSFNCS
jgi:hypothetical protein